MIKLLYTSGNKLLHNAAGKLIYYAESGFISTWKTDNAGISNSDQISLPLWNSGTYNFIVKWGDGTQSYITAWDQAETTHTYPSAGTYTVSIIGVCHVWSFDEGRDRLKLLTINAWGTGFRFGNSINVFNGCINLNIITSDPPDMTGATSMNGWFVYCAALNQDLSLWDISNITNMVYALTLTGLSTVNYSNTLIGWASQTVQPNVNLGAVPLKYNSGAITARGILTGSPNNWIITDDGLE